MSMNGVVRIRLRRFAAVDRLASYIKNPAQGYGSNRNLDRRAGGTDLDTTLQTVSGTHGHAAHHIVTQMLLDFQYKRPLRTVQLQRIINFRQVTVRKFYVYHYTTNGVNLASCH
jgi:hypothetical protein